VRTVGDYGRHLLRARRAAAAPNEADPTVVVLTPRAWTGGWWGFDPPTNLIEIGQRHVWVAGGRDYHDVPPLKGAYSGGTASALDVTVDMTRLA
jgi:transglutaminase-like putative cysteine protease